MSVLEARRSAFSQGSDPATQTANNTEQTANNTAQTLSLLQLFANGFGIQMQAQQIAQQQGGG